MKSIKKLLLAVLGGLGIGIGGIVYLSIDNKIIGALMFAVGLYTICIHGLNLYTGKVGYLVNQPVSYLKDLGIIWVGNLIGTAAAAVAANSTRIFEAGAKAVSMCEVKLADSYSSLFILAVFCGMLMYIAVEGYKVTGNPVILYACVGTFILCGFEHCVADMFYFSVAKMWSASAFIRIVVITLGNSLGGVLIPLVKKIPDKT